MAFYCRIRWRSNTYSLSSRYVCLWLFCEQHFCCDIMIMNGKQLFCYVVSFLGVVLAGTSIVWLVIMSRIDSSQILCLLVCISQPNYSSIDYVLYGFFISLNLLIDNFTHVTRCSYFVRFEVQIKTRSELPDALCKICRYK